MFPTVCSFSPVAPIFCKAVADWFACSSRLRSLCSVSIISLCRASYWSWEIVPFRSASSACCCAVFKVSSFSLVSETACASSLCFCTISSVFPGSSFSSFSTSFSWLCVFLISVLTPFRAVCNFVVSPPISTVIPLILFPAIRLPPKSHKKRYKNTRITPGTKKAPAAFDKCFISHYIRYLSLS